MRAVIIGLFLALSLSACERQRDTTASPSASQPQVSELQITDTQVGDGTEVQPGMTAVVHYTGWLYDPSASENKGKQFDTSRARGEPFRFRVGAGQVIRGWDEGVAGMKVNGQRLLVIPSELGYGPMGAGNEIPPNAPLLFEVELLGVEEG